MTAAEREPQHHGCFGSCRGVRRGVHGQLQVLGPVGESSVRLGHSEVEQQCRPLAGRRRFGERPAQEDGLRLGSALLPRRARGLDQPLDDPAIGGRIACQQVLGDVRGRARVFGEQLGGAAVALRALGARESRVEPVPDDRMHEPQRPAVLEDSRSRQQICRLGRLLLFETRELRCLEKVALLEYCQRSCEPPGMLRQPLQPEADRTTDRLYSAFDASLAHRLHELAH